MHQRRSLLMKLILDRMSEHSLLGDTLGLLSAVTYGLFTGDYISLAV